MRPVASLTLDGNDGPPKIASKPHCSSTTSFIHHNRRSIMYISKEHSPVKAKPVIDYRTYFHPGMTAEEILGIDFRDFYGQEESSEKRFHELFWQKDPEQFRKWAAQSLYRFMKSSYSEAQLKEYENLRLRKALFSKLASFKFFIFDDIERLVSSWYDKKSINLTHKERMLKLLAAERFKVSWMVNEVIEEMGSVFDLKIVKLWDEDKELLAALLKSNILNQAKLASIVGHLRIGPVGSTIDKAIETIAESMDKYGVSVNHESLKTEYFRWRKRNLRRAKKS
jgi:hypothetical protein